MTPMQLQYNKIKEEYSDCIILFRLGDFYEAFNEDAKLISDVLGITLTGRGQGETRSPMAGIPHHALKNYLPKLVDAGLKVAIADQLEEAVPGKLVERQVTQIITSGTIIDESSLESSKNNYISFVFLSNVILTLDITTGELKAFETKNNKQIAAEIGRIAPKEVICFENDETEVRNIFNKRITPIKSIFNIDAATEFVKNRFNVNSLRSFGIKDESNTILALAHLLKHLEIYQKLKIDHIKNIKLYDFNEFIQLDSNTIKNLEIFYSYNGDEKAGTNLYSILDICKTSLGRRKLRSYLLFPLKNKQKLAERLDTVEFFFNNRLLSSETREILKNISDIERIVGRMGLGTANPKDLIGLKVSLDEFSIIIQLLSKIETSGKIKKILDLYSHLEDKISYVVKIIEQTIKDDPSASVLEGNFVKDGFSSEIDNLRSIKQNSRDVLAQIRQKEIELTGISSLKVSYNKVFGYYIEVTNSQISKVPGHFIRKQTLANAERFITQELKEIEDKILNAEHNLLTLEQEIYRSLLSDLVKYCSYLLEIADLVAEIDVFTNFAEISKSLRLVKPKIEENENCLEIQNGRHITIENTISKFTPNSTQINDNEFIHIITGPNMSGKSTYIRQVAMIVIMAQIGCFVPADSMRFSLVDKVFTRVGAADNISRGESTFMVEMTETANILNNATENSLVILDEVGRGTSTYDGVAIAWSIVEYIFKNMKCKTLFATHYHELTELSTKYSGIKNYNVEVLEENGQIYFQHKIAPGAASKSYGIHVAKLAGVPESVVSRAEEILSSFETKDKNPTQEVIQAKPTKSKPSRPKRISPEQLGFL